MATQASVRELPFSSRSALARVQRVFLAKAWLTLLATVLLAVFLMPFLYMTFTSLKSGAQFSLIGPLWPAAEATFNYQGKDYPLLSVPTDQGIKEWALVDPGREQSQFVDPANPDAGLIDWVGRWRTLDRVWRFAPQWSNFTYAFNVINFGRLFFNTFAIAAIGMIGTVLSCMLVAYGFARFRIPFKGVMFIILMATIILPPQVTLIPTYAFFTTIGWTGTWLPLLVPHFFANAYNTFLFRQFFLTIPRELDEAAMIDGASPFQILTKVIIPQSWPAIIAVGLGHFFWAWNDFFGPLIYLSGKPELQPISVGIQQFNVTYGQQPNMIQAVALMSLVLPVVVFFFAQRFFMQGIVITGVEK